MAVACSLTDSTGDTTDGTSYTFTARALGAADSTRLTVVAVFVRHAAAGVVSALTVGGVSAVQLAVSDNTPAGNGDGVSLWEVDSSALTTTENIVVTTSATVMRCGVGVYRLTGAKRGAFNTISSTANNPSGSLNVPLDGAAIGIGTSATNTTATWTGLTEDLDTQVESQCYTTASKLFATVQSSLTVTSTFVTNTIPAMCAASWAPVTSSATYPVIAAITGGNATTTTPTLTLPASVVSGDLLIAIYIANTTISRTLTWPAGWTEMWDSPISSRAGSAAWRTADGTEGGSVSPTVSGSISSAGYCVLRITGVKTGQAPEWGTFVGYTTTTTPDPPAATPSWGSDYNMFLVILHGGVVSAYPTNYSDNQYVSGSASPNIINICSRNLSATTDDPGTFTVTSTSVAVGTVVIRGVAPPAGIIMSKFPDTFIHMLVR